MFNYEQYCINESLDTIKDDYLLVKSKKGNYYRHKDYNKPIDSSWKIEPNGFISVDGYVRYEYTDITYIPFLFNKITGSFNCSFCKSLISLKGCPEYVGENFSCCSCNALTSLEGCPRYVGDDFYCYECNSLITLKGSPDIVKGNFYCFQCKLLESFDGCTQTIDGSISSSNCSSLKSFEGIPSIVKESFSSYNCNRLRYLDYFPMVIGKISLDPYLEEGVNILMNLYNQHPKLIEIKDYALFVNTVIDYAPELKKYYNEIPIISDDTKNISTFI